MLYQRISMHKSIQWRQNYAFCIYCWFSFTISHGKRSVLTKHVGKKKHLDNVEFANISEKPKIHNFFKEDNQSAVIQAELYFPSILIKHNMPLAAVDHADLLFCKMFASCDVAKWYGCACTKTTAIVKELASSAIENVINLFLQHMMEAMALTINYVHKL